MPTDPAMQTALARKHLVERLRGHTTSAHWLPEGLAPELDELRAEQLRLRSQIAAERDALRALTARFTQEDAEFAQALREAYRSGTADSPAKPPDDRRTPAEQRAAESGAATERLWAAAEVLADCGDTVIETVREHETEWLGDLRSQLTGVQEKRREAERLLAEARAEEFRAHRLGAWIQATADDLAMGRQPAPTVVPMPERFVLPQETLERPWHKVREWAAKSERVPA